MNPEWDKEAADEIIARHIGETILRYLQRQPDFILVDDTWLEKQSSDGPEPSA